MKPARRICCSKCGLVWKIEKDRDTSKGYKCPYCDRVNIEKEAIKNNEDYSVYTFYGAWHGCRRRIGA